MLFIIYHQLLPQTSCSTPGFNTHCTYCSQNGIVWGFFKCQKHAANKSSNYQSFYKGHICFCFLKNYIHLLASFVPDHSHLTREEHDLLTLINSLCYITCEFPILLSYLPELSELCHLIHRPLKGSRPHMQYTVLFHELFKHQCSSIIHLWLALFLPLYWGLDLWADLCYSFLIVTLYYN